ncbi:hypothetical protein [Hazenella coriacea]|uniref:Uncharacterized protein n=1 Tax=Hazenella coriacea TaxID=1179467 RepID=A0A4R3L998_9BACL|nr:hypothetical protein [Hazenella coriacea]TCS95675.1 hypothetical protein EDD58_102251 [Hazenella coriacea]
MKLWKKVHLNWIGICGIVLSLLSLYGIILMSMEVIYDYSVNNRYEMDYITSQHREPLKDPDQPAPPDHLTFIHKNHKVELTLKPKKEVKKSIFVSNEAKESIWVGDIEIYLNGKQLDTLNNRLLVRSSIDIVGEELLSLEEDISIFLLKDHKTNQEQLMILEETSDYEVRDERNRIDDKDSNYNHLKHYKNGLEEMLKFRLWKVQSDGSYTKEEFYWQIGKRTYLQTFIIHNIGYPIGHYTQLLNGYGVLPFLICVTEVIGLVLIVFGLERRHWLD